MSFIPKILLLPLAKALAAVFYTLVAKTKTAHNGAVHLQTNRQREASGKMIEVRLLTTQISYIHYAIIRGAQSCLPQSVGKVRFSHYNTL